MAQKVLIQLHVKLVLLEMEQHVTTSMNAQMGPTEG